MAVVISPPGEDRPDGQAPVADITDPTAPAAPAPERRTGRAYWQAQGLVELSLARFEAAAEAGDAAGQRQASYVLAAFHRRTRRIIRSALADRREALAQAALRNLVVLQRPLARMHAANPEVIPLVAQCAEHEARARAMENALASRRHEYHRAA